MKNKKEKQVKQPGHQVKGHEARKTNAKLDDLTIQMKTVKCFQVKKSLTV